MQTAAKKQGHANPFRNPNALTAYTDSIRLKRSQRDMIDDLCREYDVEFATVVRTLIDKGLESLFNDVSQDEPQKIIHSV